MVQVFAEVAVGNFLHQVFVGGGQYAHVHRDFLFAAHAGDFIFLQGPQHLGLGRETHVTDFIEEKRAAVGLLKLADALLDGRSEGAFFVAKKFAFN